MFWAPYWKSDSESAPAADARPSGPHRRGARRGRGARLGAYRRAAGARRAGHQARVVVGSSIGSLVGGCYAAGKLDMLEAFARSLTRRRMFGLIDFSFAGGGLIGGERLRARLEAELGGVRIEDLPIRFAGVATEIGGLKFLEKS